MIFFALFEVSFLDEKLTLTIELSSEKTALVVIAIRKIVTTKLQFVIKTSLLNDNSVIVKQFSFSISQIVLPYALVYLSVRIAINTQPMFFIVQIYTLKVSPVWPNHNSRPRLDISSLESFKY